MGYSTLSLSEIDKCYNSEMKLIVGIGNPGEDYKNNRHNVGFKFIDELSSSKLPSGAITKKSDKFMNDSGVFVKNLATYYKLHTTDLYIVHDDLDIKLGEYKIQFAKGPKDHNGILSIEAELGTNEFWRIRIGVENRDLTNKIPGEQYVLQDFNKSELEVINTIIKKAVVDLLQNYLSK